MRITPPPIHWTAYLSKNNVVVQLRLLPHASFPKKTLRALPHAKAPNISKQIPASVNYRTIKRVALVWTVPTWLLPTPKSWFLWNPSRAWQSARDKIKPRVWTVLYLVVKHVRVATVTRFDFITSQTTIEYIAILLFNESTVFSLV